MSYEHVKAWRKRHPDRWNAHKKVFVAMRNGTLVKMPCEECGDTESECHHDDYSKPLEVRWLCDRHHGEADSERKKRENLLKSKSVEKPLEPKSYGYRIKSRQ